MLFFLTANKTANVRHISEEKWVLFTDYFWTWLRVFWLADRAVQKMAADSLYDDHSGDRVGAVVGGWISTFFGFWQVDGFNFGSFGGSRGDVARLSCC